MRNKPLTSLKLSRYIAVVLAKQSTGGKATFIPLVGVNLVYTHGYPEFFVNILDVDTDGTILGTDLHVSGHEDIVAIRTGASTDLGYTSLLKRLNERDEPMAVAFSIPKSRFLPGFDRNKLSEVRRHWRIAADEVREGLRFEFRFWPEKRKPTLNEVNEYYAREGVPLRVFTHDGAANLVSLALYEGGPDIEVALDFQIDQPIVSSAEGPVTSQETVTIGAPRKTRKT